MKHSILLCCAALLTVSEEVRSRCSLKHRKSLLISDLSMDPVPMDYSSHINDPSCRWGNREGEVGGVVCLCVCASHLEYLKKQKLGMHSLTLSTFEPESPDYLTSVSAPFHASATHTSFPDMVRLEEVCFFRAEKMVRESQVFHCHFTSGDSFFPPWRWSTFSF